MKTREGAEEGDQVQSGLSNKKTFKILLKNIYILNTALVVFLYPKSPVLTHSLTLHSLPLQGAAGI